MMVRFKLWLSLSLVYGLFPLAAFASDCSVDPDECTLKKLCEAATALDVDNTIWSTESSSVKHVNTAKILAPYLLIAGVAIPKNTWNFSASVT